MSFFPHYAPFFLFSAPSKWNVFFRITEIGAHKLRLHAPFTMDIIKGRLLFDAFSDVFMSCICFADTVNICGNKHIFIVIVIHIHVYYLTALLNDYLPNIKVVIGKCINKKVEKWRKRGWTLVANYQESLLLADTELARI